MQLFLSVIGSKHYAVLKGIAENRLEEKTFEQLYVLMERYIRPVPNEILFVQHKRQKGL